jgi:hypothetical protein
MFNGWKFIIQILVHDPRTVLGETLLTKRYGMLPHFDPPALLEESGRGGEL